MFAKFDQSIFCHLYELSRTYGSLVGYMDETEDTQHRAVPFDHIFKIIYGWLFPYFAILSLIHLG